MARRDGIAGIRGAELSAAVENGGVPSVQTRPNTNQPPTPKSSIRTRTSHAPTAPAVI